MKPPPFRYSRPESLDEAVTLLAELGGDGKVLAGGQSLVPVLNMRLAAPRHLVDVNRLRELAYVRSSDDGVRVGALARHADVEHDDGAARQQPLLRQAVRLVAHPTIRNRGTTVGSLAHADPSGEMTAVLALLGGTVELASRQGRRTVPAQEFFVGPLESSMRPGELAVEAFFPALPPQSGTSFVEVARRHGDYAVCGVGAAVTLDDDGGVRGARLGFISIGLVPVVVDVTEAAPASGVSDAGDGGDWSAAADAVDAGIEPEGDIHASADYRRHLARVLAVRALRSATRRAARGAAA